MNDELKQWQAQTMPDIHEESRRVSKAAAVYGGSFEQVIFGRALKVADRNNTMKIKATWHDEWQKNLKFFELAEME